MVKITHADSPNRTTLQQLATYCRVYIWGLIGGMLMPDKSANKVHLMYLPLLADLDWAGLYNWGLTCLAHLYKEKCRTIYPTSKKGRMCSVVTVLGMVSHVVHSTKDRASVVISTCNLVNEKFSQTRSIFCNIFDTNILHFTRLEQQRPTIF